MSIRLPNLGENMRQPSTPGLGLNLQLPVAGNFGIPGIPNPSQRFVPTPVFGFDFSRVASSTSSAALPILLGGSSSANSSGFSMVTGGSLALFDLAEGSAKSKAKLTMIATVVDAAINGKGLADEIAKAKASGQSEKEAVACQTVKAITMGILGESFTGAISAGIPIYLTAAKLDPRVAATLPVVLPLLPYAYKGAEGSAQAIAQFAEGVCHVHFR